MKIHDGDVLTVFGERRAVIAGEVGGAPEFLDRRVRDRIKREFAMRAKEIMRGMPPDLRPKKLAVKDTRSRWGSCSAAGAISLSWRLAFAPPPVMRYVVVHECCHLAEMNHGAEFWNLVARFCPGHGAARAWLRRNGGGLFEF
ncbi:MAG: M48 family metallopeptidase [Rickettsiales bacterium]|jgi:predicted metal-dependent hydrolase|nr:M48 family metallopeptidase [Rickettsiales bacterium]